MANVFSCFLSKCVNLFEKYPFDFHMFQYFHIDISPAVMNNIHCQDLGPLFCVSTDLVMFYFLAFNSGNALNYDEMKEIEKLCLRHQAQFLRSVTGC